MKIPQYPLGLSLVCLWAPTAVAAEAMSGAGEEDASRTLEEIVVTAQRRAENLQQVPIATTAFTAERLNELGIDQSNQIAFSTPNLYINGSAENAAKITLRGVGSNDFIPTANPGVGTYVDEVFNGMASAQTFQLFDLDRVEVLRGPQGTLYGKNSTGGTINYVTTKPQFGERGGYLRAGAGNFESAQLEGAINVPLAENLASRFSFLYRTRDGYIDNRVRAEDGRFLDAWGARLQTEWAPSDSLSVAFKLHGSRYDGDSVHRQAFGSLPGGVDIIGYSAPLDPFINENDLDTFDENDTFGASVRLEWDLGGVTLTSITAHERSDRDIDDDVDDGPFALTHNRFTNDSDFVSQELRLAGSGERFAWVAGAQYYDESHDVSYDLRFFECTLDDSCALLPGVFPPVVFDGNDFGPAFAPLGLTGLPIATTVDLLLDQDNTSWAVFGDATYDLTDRFSLTAGLRVTFEDREIVDTSIVTPVAAPPGTTGGLFPGFDTFTDSESWDNVSGRVVLDYQASDDLLLYGSVATGFRAGNFNGASFARIQQLEQPVDPEEIINYEAGIKSTLLNDRLRLNGAVFFSDFTDLQVAIFENSQQFLRNAADADIFGAELELDAVITDRWTARLAVGWLDTEYKNFVETRDDPATPGVDETRDLSGNRLVNAPEWTLSGSLQYRTAITANWDVEAAVDARYQSEVFFTPFNDLITDLLQQDGYGIVNLRVDWESAGDRLSFGAFVLNLSDREYATDGNGIGSPFFYDLVAYGPPRTWGVRGSLRF